MSECFWLFSVCVSSRPLMHLSLIQMQKFYIRVVQATEILIKSKFKEDWGKIFDFLPYVILKFSSNISEIFNGWAEYLQSTYIQHHSYLNFSVQSVFFNKTQRQQSSSSYLDTMQKKNLLPCSEFYPDSLLAWFSAWSVLVSLACSNQPNMKW